MEDSDLKYVHIYLTMLRIYGDMKHNLCSRYDLMDREPFHLPHYLLLWLVGSTSQQMSCLKSALRRRSFLIQIWQGRTLCRALVAVSCRFMHNFALAQLVSLQGSSYQSCSAMTTFLNDTPLYAQAQPCARPQVA